MKYPKKFKSKIDGLIVEFTNINSGYVTDIGNSKSQLQTGDYSDLWAPHTDTEVWEEVNEMTELETLKQQVAEMQATIASMKQESKPEVKQWEPQGGEWFINLYGKVANAGSKSPERLFGVEYQTKEQAEWSSKQMRKFNRLLCYIAEHTDKLYDISINTDSSYSLNIVIDLDVNSKLRDSLHSKIQSGEVVL